MTRLFNLSLSQYVLGFYNPKAFFIHAVSLGQAFAHCPRFPTAASRRSRARVSVPMWPFALSGRLPIIALVSRYLTNWLIGYRPLSECEVSCEIPHFHCPSMQTVNYMRY